MPARTFTTLCSCAFFAAACCRPQRRRPQQPPLPLVLQAQALHACLIQVVGAGLAIQVGGGGAAAGGGEAALRLLLGALGSLAGLNGGRGNGLLLQGW